MSEQSPQAIGSPSKTIKVIITALILFHGTAMVCSVLAGGGPTIMRQMTGHFRPYLGFFWLTNGYRYYAPNPGDTDVLWFHIKYDDGSTHWYVIPNRDDFYLRMPFQRYMSIAMLAIMTTRWEETPATEDAASAASIMARNRGVAREVLHPFGEVYFRSYARFVARHYRENLKTHALLDTIDIYRVHYLIRTPYEVRMNYDMYDPRKLDISMVGTYAPDGTRLTQQRGFIPRVPDDFFIELVQNEIAPLLEENNRLPPGERKTLAAALKDYGVPYPLVMPVLRLPEEEQRKFFDKPLDRDTLRERYAQAVRRFDRSIGTPTPERQTVPEPTKPSGTGISPNAPAEPSRTVR
jgi:hypothetical protein